MKELYTFKITNSTHYTKKAIILGHDEFLASENFGSEEGIQIKSLNEKSSYEQVLCETAKKRFQIDVIKIESSNISQVISELMLTNYKEGVKTVERTILMQAYYSAYQTEAGIIEAPMIDLTLDSSMCFEYEVFPNTELSLTLIGREIKIF